MYFTGAPLSAATEMVRADSPAFLGAHVSCISPSLGRVLHVSFNRYSSPREFAGVAGAVRRMLAVRNEACVDGSSVRVNVQSVAPVDFASRALKNASCVAWSGSGKPAAPIAPVFSLLTIIAARLGSTFDASKF